MENLNSAAAEEKPPAAKLQRRGVKKQPGLLAFNRHFIVSEERDLKLQFV